MGLLLAVAVTSAAVHDAEAAKPLTDQLGRRRFPRLQVVWVDSTYHNHGLYDHLEEKQAEADWWLQPVRRPDGSQGWVKLPERWVVERTFGWVGRYRANSKDYEHTTRSSEGMILVSMIQLMTRRLKPAKDYPDLKYSKKAA